jgi:hypothetical protein
MTQRPAVGLVTSVVAEAPPAGTTVAKPAGLQLLGGDEIIQLSIRPSPWCIVLYSFKLVVAAVLAATAVVSAARVWPSWAVTSGLGVIALAGFSAVVAATLHWASQIYVLTNRRVLRFSGAFNMDVAQCTLAQIGEVRLHATWYDALLRLGSLHLTPGGQGQTTLVWEHVARPAEVQEILVRAIQKSKADT